MKTLSVFLLLVLCGCGPTVVYQQPESFNSDPAGDAYKAVLVRNESPFWVIFSTGTQNVVLPAGGEIVLQRLRSYGWLSPGFGQFSFMAYAYRKFDGRHLHEFIGQQEFWVYLNGYTQNYNGRTFGGIVVMSGFPISTTGFPDQCRGNIGPFPFSARFIHQ